MTQAVAQRVRRPRLLGGLVTVGTVLALVVAMGLTVLGLGATDHAVANYDASSWLWSRVKGELARVNGGTAKVDTRVKVPAAAGHGMQVTQTDRFLLLRDTASGRVSALDLATLRTTATSETTVGLGVNIALEGDSAFIVDTVQGVVRQLDPRTLTPIGEPVRYPPGITSGTFDGRGRLWIGVPSEGTVSAVTPAPLPATDGGSGAGAPAGPALVKTLAVAAPSHDLSVSGLDDGVAVLDRTSGRLTTLRGDAQREVRLQLGGPAAMPPRTNGADVPVTVLGERHVYVVRDGAVRDFAVPGAGDRLRPAVAWAGRFYCADDATGAVYVLDGSGKLVRTIGVRGANGPLDLEVREEHLFINAPNASTARVVDSQHRVKEVDKYANDVLGGDPPPPPPPPPPPKEPPVGPPGAPRGVTATAGDAEARVSWKAASANGAAISRYVVAGAGKTLEVGADQRSVAVTGLTNGETYQFTVHAVNRKGAGPKRTSNPVVPTSEVPDPPASVSASAKPDGTVEVGWPAANGQGRDIARYAVTAVSEGASATVGEATGTSLVIKAGELEYGRQYAFTVVAVNDRGASSEPSPVSATVVPFAAPAAPVGLTAATVPDQAGAVRVSWQAPTDNGRPITGYVVSAGGTDRQVTDTEVTLTGLGNDKAVTVKVKAVNEAGEGAEATAEARTVAPPTVTVTRTTGEHTSVSVAFTVNDGGGQTSCTLSVGAVMPKTGACTVLTVSGLKPSTSYNFTLAVTNAAGTGRATGTAATAKVYGTSVCVNNTASADTAQRVWCNDTRNGMEVYSGTNMNTTRLGRGSNGARYEAICKANGEGINDYVYNPGKMGTGVNDSTPIWIRINFGGRQGYMSFAWFNLEGYGKNEHAVLPSC
ncbi:MAG TPA: fibronectin type III domain-containing protein [Pilimelia sp.]|nr:fibronectin type III domain-containing protein [Pilimelia sp.]